MLFLKSTAYSHLEIWHYVFRGFLMFLTPYCSALGTSESGFILWFHCLPVPCPSTLFRWSVSCGSSHLYPHICCHFFPEYPFPFLPRSSTIATTPKLKAGPPSFLRMPLWWRPLGWWGCASAPPSEGRLSSTWLSRASLTYSPGLLHSSPSSLPAVQRTHQKCSLALGPLTFMMAELIPF